MKKIILWMIASIAIFVLNGCGNVIYDDNYNNYHSDNTILYLVDDQGFAYADIPYKCDSMVRWGHTAPNGEFSFVEPDTCEFDFNGLDGLYGDAFDDIVKIVDYRNEGKGDIDYDCISFGASSTYSDGSFDYDEDDECVFYL